jgi:hypothetical protein
MENRYEYRNYFVPLLTMKLSKLEEMSETDRKFLALFMTFQFPIHRKYFIKTGKFPKSGPRRNERPTILIGTGS